MEEPSLPMEKHNLENLEFYICKQQVHAKDVINPLVYLSDYLHDDLLPNFEENSLNGGTYKLISDSKAKISVYYYDFPITFPANNATAANLELLRLTKDISCDNIEEILPSCGIIFDEYVIPSSFHDTTIFGTIQRLEGRLEERLEGQLKETVIFQILNADVDASVLAGIKEKLRLKFPDHPASTSSQPASTSSQPDHALQPSFPLSIEGNEDSRNQVLAAWLKSQLDKLQTKFVVIANEQSPIKICRHSRSKEDFAFFSEKQDSEALSGASVGFQKLNWRL